MPLRTHGLDTGSRIHLATLANPGPPVTDEDGGYTDSWIPLSPPTWRCSITAATAANTEQIVAGSVQATATHLVRGPYHPGITPATRMFFHGKVFEVQSVQNEDERNIQLTLVCAEIKSYGGPQRTDDSGTDGTAGGPPPPPD